MTVPWHIPLYQLPPPTGNLTWLVAQLSPELLKEGFLAQDPGNPPNSVKLCIVVFLGGSMALCEILEGDHSPLRISFVPLDCALHSQPCATTARAVVHFKSHPRAGVTFLYQGGILPWPTVFS